MKNFLNNLLGENFPRTVLLLPALGLFLFGFFLWVAHNPLGVPKEAIQVGYQRYVMPGPNVKFVGKAYLENYLKAHHIKPKQVSLGEKIGNMLVPPVAAATNTATPGANVNLQLATPQTSAGYVACNFAISPLCKIYVNATISTTAFYNGIDGVTYTVVFVQDGSGHTVAAPTAGGTPAGITTQVAGWAVQNLPLLGAQGAPTAQANTATTWTMYYDSSLGAFLTVAN